MNRFLADLSAAERRGNSALVEAVADHLRARAAPFGVFDAHRFATTGLTMAAAAPWLPLPDPGDLAAIPLLWNSTVNDCLNEGPFRPEDRARRLRHDAPSPQDPNARALPDGRRCLAARPRYGALAGEWVGVCREMLARRDIRLA